MVLVLSLPVLPLISAVFLFALKKRFGIDILYGVELNILDVEGHIDLSEELLDKLDYAIISMHRQNYRSGSVSQNTQAYINAMKHPAVKILGHCDDTHFPVDYETLAKTALQENVIFEINEASLAPYGYQGRYQIKHSQNPVLLPEI